MRDLESVSGPEFKDIDMLVWKVRMCPKVTRYALDNHMDFELPFIFSMLVFLILAFGQHEVLKAVGQTCVGPFTCSAGNKSMLSTMIFRLQDLCDHLLNHLIC